MQLVRRVGDPPQLGPRLDMGAQFVARGWRDPHQRELLLVVSQVEAGHVVLDAPADQPLDAFVGPWRMRDGDCVMATPRMLIANARPGASILSQLQ